MVRKQNAKCPECGVGEMKMVLPPPSLTGGAKKPIQAQCSRCGYEKDYLKVYPPPTKAD
jgi:rubredoxin